MIEFLYKDNDVAVCIKPVGMDSESQLPDAIKKELGGEIFPIHRLDKNVGGVMVYARTKRSAAALSRAVQDGTMIKEYRALVHGEPPKSGDWTDFLFKDSSKNKVFVVKRERKGVKEARLEYNTLRTFSDGISLVHVRLHTGRTHQIRVQFASRGFPLVGDRKYGAKDDVKAPQLFSCRITFPYRGKSAVFETEPAFTERGPDNI